MRKTVSSLIVKRLPWGSKSRSNLSVKVDLFFSIWSIWAIQGDMDPSPLTQQPDKKTKNNLKCSIPHLICNEVYFKCKKLSDSSVEVVLRHLVSIPQIISKDILKHLKPLMPHFGFKIRNVNSVPISWSFLKEEFNLAKSCYFKTLKCTN